MKAEFRWPGIAVWRWKEHGRDVWSTGVALNCDMWRWAIGVVILDFDLAPGFHFDHFHLLWIRLGPLELCLYIRDEKN